MSQSKESLIWWQSPVDGEKHPKWEKNPNELYNLITQEEKEEGYETPCSKTAREEDNPFCEGGLRIHLSWNIATHINRL